ncbi:T9SS type A sorting domain-containing protein [Polaribacter glomeratus]|nr:T9SS type A sorting domain-containing protein [Polaribacter glomeratus]
MKKTTFLFFTIISVSLFGQTKLTSSLSEYYDGTNWVSSNKTAFIYDANNNLTEEKELSWDVSSNQWQTDRKNLYTYNSNNKTIVELYQSYDANTIVHQSRTTNTYNSSGNLMQILDEKYENSVWINSSKVDITYSNNRIVSGLSYDWNGTAWAYGDDSGQTIINYNTNGTISSSVSESWDGSNWVADYKAAYSYNVDNKVSMEEDQTWDGTAWIVEYRTEYTYDANGNVVGEMQTYFNEGVEAGSNNETYFFDTTKLMSSFTHPFNDKTGIEYLFSVNKFVNKILSEASNNYRLTYNYGEATAGVNDFSLVNFAVYPNPTNNKLSLDDSGFSLKNVELFNILGKKVMTSTTNQLNLENLVNGIYVLKVQDEKGNIASKRIVKN